MLSRSRDTLPLHFAVLDDFPDFQNTNAQIQQQCQASDYPPDEQNEYGPVGTIGLEFETTQRVEIPLDLKVDNLDDAFYHDLQQFGCLEQRTEIIIRMAHLPSGADFGPFPDEPSLCTDLMELIVNGSRIRFYRSAKHRRGFYEISTNLCRERIDRQIGMTVFEDQGIRDCTTSTGNWDERKLRVLVHVFRNVTRELLDIFFRGFFHLSAVRMHHGYESLDLLVRKTSMGYVVPKLSTKLWRTTHEDLQLGESRYVGPSGEATLAIQRCFADSRMNSDASSSDCASTTAKPIITETFVSFWLNKLVNVRIENDSLKPGHSLSDTWSDDNAPPRGVLASDEAPKHIRDIIYHDCMGECRFLHPCFGVDCVHPERLSSGFHQLAPIVVQIAVMLRGEIIGIENPEVHLHPSLQLAVAEFLMHQVVSDRTVIIETHSDLIIRRVIREILEEEIPLGQEAIGIYFTDLSSQNVYREGKYSSSRLTRLTVNEKTGQIDNWPEGFLGDDVQEAKRLMDVMYGGHIEDEE